MPKGLLAMKWGEAKRAEKVSGVLTSSEVSNQQRKDSARKDVVTALQLELLTLSQLICHPDLQICSQVLSSE